MQLGGGWGARGCFKKILRKILHSPSHLKSLGFSSGVVVRDDDAAHFAHFAHALLQLLAPALTPWPSPG